MATTALAQTDRHKAARRRKWREALTAYGFLAPYLFIFLTFTVFAIGYAFYLSFTRYNLLKPPEFWGLEGYRRVLCLEALLPRAADAGPLVCDDLFIRKALPNTILYTVIVVPAQTILSLILAFAMDQNLRFRRLFRTIFYLPSVTSSVVISIIFIWLFSPQGVVNQIFGLNINWLNDKNYAFYTIMLLNVFTTSGTMMLILLAGLQDIPVAIYEAAAMDGANKLQSLWHITIPMLRPVIFFVVTVGVIGCFQVFDQIYVMTAGGPLDSTTTVAYLIYKWAFRDTAVKMGQASALAFVLALIIMAVTMIQRKFIEGSGSVSS
ncbi:MAG TPA: sugar ABC transporter permease [Anaerolineaceae bacterium]|nr:sugar ABC transporter permease [Anaerolineaceae bacterium]HPN51638.1 sugar ABC transporter permease [Anaerolineaceae bacterium]